MPDPTPGIVFVTRQGGAWHRVRFARCDPDVTRTLIVPKLRPGLVVLRGKPKPTKGPDARPEPHAE